jgi:hypothetical protein
MFVTLEELAFSVAGKAFSERSAIPVKRHAFSICDFAGFNVLTFCAGAISSRVCLLVTLSVPTGERLQYAAHF